MFIIEYYMMIIHLLFLGIVSLSKLITRPTKQIENITMDANHKFMTWHDINYQNVCLK